VNAGVTLVFHAFAAGLTEVTTGEIMSVDSTGTDTVAASNVTSPSLNALPFNVAPVCNAMYDVPVVKIFPLKVE
jgi:hypothetical protein